MQFNVKEIGASVNHLEILNTYYRPHYSLRSNAVKLLDKPYIQDKTSSAAKRVREREEDEGVEEEKATSIKYIYESDLSVDFVDLLNLMVKMKNLEEQLLKYIEKEVNIDECFARVCVNDRETPVKFSMVGLHSTEFILPPKAAFLIHDIKFSAHIIASIRSYINSQRGKKGVSFVVMDPPWPNMSAIRSSSYNTMGGRDVRQCLLSLQLPLLPQALVFMWVTNDQRYSQFVSKTLFPSWHVHFVGLWRWWKVTTSNELCVPYDREARSRERRKERKPYERILVGRFCSSYCMKSDSSDLTISTCSGCGYSTKDTSKPSIDAVPVDGNVTAVETHKDFACVPFNNRHSCKPPVEGFLEGLEPAEGIRLEIFARECRKGFLSIGNEAIKFNNSILFVAE
jgi:N6-adenosine-specific RNA methylase IME4